MSMRKLPLALAAVALGACAEPTGPPRAVVPDGAQALHILRWKDGLSARRYHVTARGLEVLPDAQRMSFSITGNPGEVQSVSFWAVRGQTRSVRIDYEGADQSGSFLEFTVPEGALLQAPDGSLYAEGDSVYITIGLDPVSYIVDLEPTGLVFSASLPAELQLWYDGAGSDFDGDGEENDEDDAYIENELLGIQYRVDPDNPWTAIGSNHSAGSNRFQVNLYHFSGYAVSW